MTASSETAANRKRPAGAGLVFARVRGSGAVTAVAPESADVCYHCHGTGTCSCCLCGKNNPTQPLIWTAGKCLPCKATGYLAWSKITEAQAKARAAGIEVE